MPCKAGWWSQPLRPNSISFYPAGFVAGNITHVGDAQTALWGDVVKPGCLYPIVIAVEQYVLL
jgi:hypothetical protein